MPYKEKLIEKLYYSIGEVAEMFEVNVSLIRFWEKEFKQIKPKIINKRRYYDINTIHLLSKIHFLLKKQGMTIKGVQKYLNNEKINVDEKNNEIIRSVELKFRLNKLSNILKTLKKINGKKNTR